MSGVFDGSVRVVLPDGPAVNLSASDGGKLSRSVWNSGGRVDTGSVAVTAVRAFLSFAHSASLAVARLISSNVAAATSTAGLVGIGAGDIPDLDRQWVNIDDGNLVSGKERADVLDELVGVVEVLAHKGCDL